MKLKVFLHIYFYFVLCFTSAKAQVQNFNKWSIEANTGFGKPISPYTPQYFSSNNDTYFAFNKFNHFDIGTRYMFSTYFGIRMGVTYVSVANAAGSSSKPFENELYKIDFQGVINMGHVLNFDQFTSRLGLLAHFGPQINKLKIKEGRFAGKMDSNGGFIIGITPQFKITDRVVLNTDFSYTVNFRQHLNWDGHDYAAKNNNLNGIMHDLTIGFTYYLGKNKQHADWDWNDLALIKTQKMLDYEAKIQNLQKDTDKDGIPDYLDLEKNTAAGSIVDSKGRKVVGENTVAKNKENVSSTSNLTQKEKDFGSIFEDGNNEVFFDFNQVNPNKDSKRKIVAIISYMKKYPETKATLNGYTDNRGGEEFNRRLGLRRSEKVKEIMVLYGIDPLRISLISKGIDEILSEDKNDLQSLELARRVVIVLQ